MKRPILLILLVLLLPVTLLAKDYTATFNRSDARATLQIITQATGYDFVYKQGLIDGITETVDGTYKNVSINELLDNTVLSQLGLSYKIVDKSISLKKATAEELSRTIRGVVIDEEGEPLPGASVLVKGTTNGVSTNIDGEFEIKIDGKNPVLQVSYVGMHATDYRLTAANTSKPLRITLKANAAIMDEVVVTGYQNIKRENATGAFQQISSADLNTRSVSNLTSNLEGKVAGMVVYNDEIQIRGTGTLKASTSPLVVVDGLPINGSLSDINPYEIDKITVLKDAAAAAIYGARASNGVIVVTTKRGVSDKLSVEFNADFSVFERRNYEDLGYCTAAELIELEQYNFDWIKNRPDDFSSVESSYGRYKGTWNPLNRMMMEHHYGNVSDADYNRQLAEWRNNDYIGDWSDFMEHNRFEQRYNLAIRTRSKVLNNNLVVNWTGDNTSLVNSYDNKLSLRYLGDLNLTKWFTASAGLQIDNLRQKGRYSDYDDTDYDSFPRYLSFYNADGTPASLQNRVDLNEPSLSNPNLGLKDESFVPVDEMLLNTTKYRETYTRAFVHLNFFPVPELKLSGMFQYEDITSKREDLQDGESYVRRHWYNLFTSGGKHYMPEGGLMHETNAEANYYTFRTQASYNKTFVDRHEISAIAGYEYRKTRSRNSSFEMYGYDEKTLTNGNGSMNFYDMTKLKSTDLGSNYNSNVYFYTTDLATFTDTEHKYISYYATLNYTFDHRYSVSGSYRIDQSDLFGADKKFTRRPLWSAGASWNAQNEAFLRDHTWIDMLKPRISYGVTGNINSNYSSYMTARIYNHSDTGDKYAKINTPPNDQLRWEQTKTFDVGIDFGFFGYRLNGSFDYYDKRGSDVLSQVDTDPTTGWSSVNMNNACTRNRGFEIQLNGEILHASRPSQVGLRAEFALAYNNNKVTSINHTATSGYQALKSTDYKQDYPVNSLYSFIYDGVRYDDNGYQQIYWLKADGTAQSAGLTSKTFEPGDVVFSGSLDPKWSGSFTPTVSWQRFSLSAMTAFYLGHKFRPNFEKWHFSTSYTYGRSAPKVYLDYWRATPEERQNIIGNGQVMNNTEMYWEDPYYSDQNIDKADYLKLRNIVLTYNFAEKVCRKIGLSSLRLRAQMNNVATWLANKEGIDPERVDALTGKWNFGTPRSYTFSINANF